MTNVILTDLRRGFYLDSVALMRLSREIGARDGVLEAALMMGSPSNIAIMREAGLLDKSFSARSNDLVLAIKAKSEEIARSALAFAAEELDRPKNSGAADNDAWTPRSIAVACRAVPDANLALISVPGDFAAAEARKALRRGLNVLMFSDNVPLADELSLKQEARDLGLLMMGPDCGTAILNGAPLAFANVVERGSIGLIGASGTGLQEISTLISEGGRGISHAIGVGGRDLKKEIGGITTMMAMDALDADASTEAVVLVSKPPHPEVAETILARIGKSPKPYTICFLGAAPLELPQNAHQAATLCEAAQLALENDVIGKNYDITKAASTVRAPGTREKARPILGLFCGGTLCAEAQVVLAAAGRSVASNAAIPGIPALDADTGATVDRVIDLGSDEYTRGRAHPMIDPSLRDDMVREAMRSDDVAVVLVDLVIGYGAHADPAENLASILAEVGGGGPVVVASVTGTEGDPQRRSRQIATLERAGVLVAPSNSHACQVALALAAL